MLFLSNPQRPSRTDTRYPAPHPPTNFPPPTPPPLVPNNNDLLHGTFSKHQELKTDSGIQSQYSRSTEPERRSQRKPILTNAAFTADPTMTAVGVKVTPCAGVGEEGGAVEEVAEEGGDEENGAEAGCGASSVVLVELRKTGAKVENGACPT